MKCAAVVLLSLALLVGCGTRDEPSQSDLVRVFVSIAPQSYVVKRIGGERVTVDALVPPAQSPATYEPSPRQMAALEDAHVYFRIGVPFEDRFMDRLIEQFGAQRVIDLRRGLTLRVMEDHEHDHVRAGKEPARGSERRDPHTWLDPILVKTQARTIVGVLSDLDERYSDEFEANYRHLAEDIDSVHALVDSILAPVKGRSLFVFHPSYGYFCDRYGLTQIAIEASGKEPSPRQLQELIAEARSADIKAILIQRQFSIAPARAVAQAIGAEIVAVDPLAPDYLDNLVAIAKAVRKAYSAGNK